MDILQLYTDYSIKTAPDGHKHKRPGWINTACPFCTTEHPGYHLGATLDGKIFYCFRCGIHFPDDSISKILNISFKQAKLLIEEYGGTSVRVKEPSIHVKIKGHRLPSNTSGLLQSHIKYLEKRNFDPELIRDTWNLISTGPVSFLDNINYSHRILAPIYWEDKQVTFQARDVTNKHPLKYMACSKEREAIHHKHIIYRHPSAKSRIGICTEGITDVWRFGTGAFATFGIEYTRQQVRLMAQLFDRVAVCFDDEPQAVRQANELISDLRFRGVDSFRVDIVGDPGGLKQKEADYIVKQIIH